MSKLKGKLARRIMAIVLSGAMVMSNMSAYAAELVPETEPSVISEIEESADAETTTNTHEEESASDEKIENAETATSVVDSSESKVEEVKTDNSNEIETETDTETETVESTETETETETAKDKETDEMTEVSENNQTDYQTDCGTYAESNDDNGNMVKTWTFTEQMPSTTVTLKDGDTVNGLLSVVTNSSSTLKLHQGNYLNYKPGDYVAVPITEGTESVQLYMYLTGNNTDRYFNIGNGTDYITVYHNNTAQTGSDGNSIVKDKYFIKDTSTNRIEWQGQISSDYFAADDDGKLWLYLEAGTLKINNASDTGEMKVGAIQITETKPSGDDSDKNQIVRTSWDVVADPEVTVDYSEGADSITVTAKGAVNDFDADELKLYMYDTASPDTDTVPIDEGKCAIFANKHTHSSPSDNDNTITHDYYYTTAKDSEGNSVSDADFDISKTQDYVYYTEFTFAPKKSGTYYFQAVLSRKSETDESGEEITYKDKPSDMSSGTIFKIPLTAPANINVSENEASTENTVAVDITWDAVFEAEKYIITAEDTANGNAVVATKELEAGENTSLKVVIDEGLERGKEYNFKVVAKRGDDTSLAGESLYSIKEFVDMSKGGRYKLDISEEYPDVISALPLGGSKEAGTSRFFTIYYRSEAGGNSKIDKDEKTFKDEDTKVEYTSKRCLNLQAVGNVKTLNAVIKFTTYNASEIKVYWRSAGGSARTMGIMDSEGNVVVKGDDDTTNGKTLHITPFTLEEPGTYYLGAIGGGNRLHKVEVIDGNPDAADRGNWDADVADPEITDITQTDDGKIAVKVKGVINSEGVGADYIRVERFNATWFEFDENPTAYVDTVIDKKNFHYKEITANTTAAEDGYHYTTFEFEPEESGTYVFRALLGRNDETITDEAGNETTVTYKDKATAYSKGFVYKIPLITPVIADLQNEAAGADGLGVVAVTWDKVNEADYYELLVTDADGTILEDKKEIGTTSYKVRGLEIGKVITVKIKAARESNSPDQEDEFSDWSAPRVITVTGEEPKGYTFNALDYVEDSGDPGIEQPAGTKFGTSNYFTVKTKTTTDAENKTVVGNTKLRKNSSGSSVWLELEKCSSASFEFTVYGVASASFTVASTGSSNYSIFGLVNAKGEPIPGTIIGSNTSSIENVEYENGKGNKGTAYVAYGTGTEGTATVKFDNLEAGTYSFVIPCHKDYGRGGRIHKAVVYDSGDMPEKDAWGEDTTGTPIISEITYIKGESDINVTASGYVGYNGADSLRVDMLDKEGNVVSSVTKASESTVNEDGTKTNVDQDFTFTPTASGDYSFRASLVRSGEDDIVMKDNAADWTMTEFVLPLAQASVSAVTNVSDSNSSDEKALGGLEVIFPSVDEADYYVVTAFSKEGKELVAKTYTDIETYVNEEGKEYKLASETDKENKLVVTLQGMPTGTAYIITQAFRELGDELKLTAGKRVLTRNVNAETGEVKVESKDSPVSEWLNDQWKAEQKEEVEKSNPRDKDNETEAEYETKIKGLVQLRIDAVSETEGGNAIAVVRSQTSEAKQKYINGKNDTRWYHSVFGSNTSSATYNRDKGLNKFDGAYKEGDDEYNKSKGTAEVPQNGYREHVYEDGASAGDLKSVELWSENGKGKVVPASTDGLSYYYTTVDPSQNNFTLSALIHVMSWQYTNGQDGFGMMVSDTVGKNGDDGATWTNAYQLLASKIQYSWYRATKDNDGNVIPGYVTNAGGNGTTIMRYEMKLGMGWNSKEGATAADVAKIKSGAATAPANFITKSGTLETSAGNNDLYTGSYNVIGNGYNKTAIPTSSVKDDKDLLTDFRLQIQKYDNAYVLRYLEVNATADLTDEDKASGNYAEMNDNWYKIIDQQVFSDDNNNKLTQIDKQNIYVGFFAARKARIDISQIDLDVTKAGDDKFVIPTTYVDPSATISSEETSNSELYDLTFSTNFDGMLTIYKDDANGREALATGKAITAGTKYTFTSKLNIGDTKFTYYAKPNENYVPGDNQQLKNDKMLTNETNPLVVTYHAFNVEDNIIYVKQNGAQIGTADADGNAAGSKANPTNVYDAVNYAAADQTIYLAGGMYNLAEDPTYSKGIAANLLIGKGHDGTSRKMITMMADPEAKERPVLNFGQNSQKNDTAFIMAGNYWRFEGFDIMGSRDGQKGILLGGSYNTLVDIRTYLNGNTGLQVARYASYGREDWPSYNTILNCSSFMNYDAGYEDADGYAAKLTCGDGNKFIGCIAAYNADDGWDLFAKVETGSIGVVTLENCLAFKNGYLFGEEDYYGSGQDLIYRYTDFSKYTKNTHVVDAGNGNGFKMGGDSMSGYHVLKNSIAFANKSKGIDSNSCPDIQIYNSISFNNEANNVAMYTNSAVNTDYYAENLVSVKDASTASGYSTEENFTLLGTQNKNKVYSATNYYWDGAKSVNSNNDVFDISWFKQTNITNAIFGSKTQGKISRSGDGSIVLNGFLEYTPEGLEALGRTDNSVIGSTPEEDVLDTIIDIYIFAADYSKGTSTLSEIDLSKFEATKNLAAGEGEGETKKEGYTWAEPDTLISAYAGTTAEFTISAKGRQDRTVAVNFIQLDGAELQIVSGDTNGNEELDYNETWTVEAVPVISPAVEPDVKMSGFSAEIVDGSKGLLEPGKAELGTVNPNLAVANAQNTFKGKGLNGDAKLTATVSLTAGGKTVKQTATLAFAVKNGEGIKFDSTDPTEESKVQWDKNTDSDYIQVAMGQVDEFTLKNLHFVEVNESGEQVPVDFGKGVKISVNDTNVIKLKGTANSANGVDATFTVVNKSRDGGTATVTVTSKKDKSLVRNYIVTVSGSDFAWTAGTVEIDKAKKNGIQLTALAPFGKSMASDAKIIVKDVYKGSNALGKTVDYRDYFEAKQVTTSSVYELNTTATAVDSLPKGTYTVVYQAEISETITNEDGTTTNKTDYIDFTPITIKVVETKPTVTFKQTKKVNLFYNNGTTGSTGTLTATSKQGAVTVTASNSEYFRFANNGAGYDIVSIKKDPVSLTDRGAIDYKDVKQNNKVTLTAHFEGYYDKYDVPKSFAIGLEYRQPKLKLTTLDKTIYTAIGMDSADVLIYDPDSDMYLNTDVAVIDLVTDPAAKKAYSKANSDFTVDAITSAANRGNGVKLLVNSDSVKGGTVKLSITYDDWFSKDPVIVSQSIKVTDKVPKLTIKPVKLNMNTKDFVGKEQVSAQILLNGTAGFTISDLKLEGTNTKAADFLKFVDYDVTIDTNGNTILLVSLKEQADDKTSFPATADSKGVYKMNPGYASSYSFKAKYKLGSVEQEANFKLSLVSKEAVTVSTKGSINIVDRAKGTVILKPKAQNFTPLQVSNVTLTGDAANLFEIVEFNRTTGETTIRAKETANLKKGSYKILPKFTYDLGASSSTYTIAPIRPVVIKTTQPALKISGLKDALEVKLSSPNTAAKRTITVGSPAGAYITGMTQTSGLNNFRLSYDAGGKNVIVTIKNRAGLKEGKTYKITAFITVEGGGANVKPQKITIPVKVIR